MMSGAVKHGSSRRATLKFSTDAAREREVSGTCGDPRADRDQRRDEDFQKAGRRGHRTKSIRRLSGFWQR